MCEYWKEKSIGRKGRGKTYEELFWEKVIVGAPYECWIWTRRKLPKGYGIITIKGVDIYVHRMSYEMHHGPIPPGIEVCHSCDNPPCVNPSHLFPGTHQDNMLDKMNKGRDYNPGAPGEKNANAKLTEEIIKEIIVLRKEMLPSQIAKIKNISAGHVRKIVSRRAWKHVQVE